MEKSHIIAEIQRTAAENDGKALGELRFKNETGIGRGDWYGIYWGSWGEAVAEAGLPPNSFKVAIPEDVAIEKLVIAIRDLGRYPRDADMKMRRRVDRSFPSDGVYRGIGCKAEVATKVVEWCSQRDGFEDVLAISEPIATAAQHHRDPDDRESTVSDGVTESGSVYLLKSGKFHKIGRTNHVGRREYDIGLQLPEKATLVHEIETDDPVGIEAYWHKRFEEKRANGEWFKLNTADVWAFKRWKRIF